jgi:hypothetical protein
MPSAVKFRRFLCLGRYALLLSLVAAAGCSHPAGLRGSDARVPPDGSPFNQETAGNPGTAANSAVDAQNRSKDSRDIAMNSATGVPFRPPSSPGAPVGTLLTVRLDNALSGSRSGPGRTFAAVVDAPVVVNGNTVVARGTAVRGRIESARTSQLARNRGYVRLTLESMQVGGEDVPLQTSSLFARASSTEPLDPAAEPIRLQKGRRLTFRLTMPLALGPAGPESSGESSLPSLE